MIGNIDNGNGAVGVAFYIDASVQAAEEEAMVGEVIGSCQQLLWHAAAFDDGSGVRWCAAMQLFSLVVVWRAAEEDEEMAMAMEHTYCLIIVFDIRLCFLCPTIRHCLPMDKLIGALPLTKCCFSHSFFQLRWILGGMNGGGLKKGENAPGATESQRCKSSASRKSFQHCLLHHTRCCLLS